MMIDFLGICLVKFVVNYLPGGFCLQGTKNFRDLGYYCLLSAASYTDKYLESGLQKKVCFFI